jgi:hypothetical protein
MKLTFGAATVLAACAAALFSKNEPGGRPIAFFTPMATPKGGR